MKKWIVKLLVWLCYPQPIYSTFIIEPYWDIVNARWCFDDASVGLEREGFSQGICTMINDLIVDMPAARSGTKGTWRLEFSAIPFPDYTMELSSVRPQDGGMWYWSNKLKIEGWLCEQLYKYFPSAPTNLYVRAITVAA